MPGIDLQIRGENGWGRVEIPEIASSDNARKVAKQLRAIIKLITAQGQAIPEVRVLDGDNPEDAKKIAELGMQGDGPED